MKSTGRFEGQFEVEDEDKKHRLGEDTLMPKRIKWGLFAR